MYSTVLQAGRGLEMHVHNWAKQLAALSSERSRMTFDSDVLKGR